MSSRTLLNLVLLVTVALLAGVVLWEPGLRGPAPPDRLSHIPARDIRQIAISRPAQADVRLQRRDTRWHLVEPIALPANELRVRSILRVLNATSHGRMRAASQDLERFGLAAPKASLVLDQLRLDFGDSEPLDGRRYVRLGDTVHLTDDDTLHQLTTSAASLVHDGPLGPDPQPVAIWLAETSLRLEDKRWILAPERPTVGADAILRLVDAWRQAQAISVRTAAAPGADGKTVRVELAGAHRVLEFQALESEHDLILVRPDVGVQYHLPQPSADRLLRLKGTPEQQMGEP